MRRQKNDIQILLIPGALVTVSVFLFLLISANSSQPSSSARTDSSSSQAVTSPVSPTPPVVPQSDAAPLLITATAAPAQPTAPAPEALRLLLPSEIGSVNPKDNGYVVTTTFGATWFFSQQDVESLPMSMKLRIDYGKYGAGSHGAERGH